MAPAASRYSRCAASLAFSRIRMRSGAFAIVAIVTACAGISVAAPLQSAALHAFDQDRIHGYYKDGDFDKVIRALDGFQKSGRKCPHADSLFLEKYLAVVYAANPATRELGRYHMHKLLDLSPSADLIDMFVGEEVDGVFDKVRKEHGLDKATASGSAPRTAAVTKATSSLSNAPRPALEHPAKAVTSANRGKSESLRGKPEPARPVSPPPSFADRPSEARPLDARPPDSWSGTDRHRDPQSQERLALARAELGGVPIETAGSELSWKDAGAWIGGGTALALVAVTLYFAGSSKEPTTKTYVVPATASR